MLDSADPVAPGTGAVPDGGRPTVSISIRHLDRLDIPATACWARLRLRHRDRTLGKVDIHRPPGAAWTPLAERWVREEAVPRLLPRYLRRWAWRDPHLLARLASLVASPPGRRFLWNLLHTPPLTWGRSVTAFLVARHAALLARRGPAEATPLPKRPVLNREAWECLFAAPDPWGYSSPYEQTKYEQTLELLPEGQIDHALELACAEGHFTVQLAARVHHLLAVDIATTALERAAARCKGHGNVAFAQLDLRRDPLPSGFDLIVCSEVLYYLCDGRELLRLARRLAAALAPGGHLLATHANAVVDDPTETGFDWQIAFGGKHIGRTLGRLPALDFVRELRTPLYRVQLFRKAPSRPKRAALPREILERAHGPLDGLDAGIHRGGCAVTRLEAANAWTTHALPILMYHRIATNGAELLAPYRVAPERFDRQLAYLRRHGYRSIGMAEWATALRERDGVIDDRVVLITFDDAYRDFLEQGWPILRSYGFGATMFVPTDHVGGHAEWDRTIGEPAALMDWDGLRALASQGLEIGAHTGSHPYLTRLTPAQALAEGAASKARLEGEIGRTVALFAYPFGDQNLLVRRAMAACGFVAAVTTEPGLSRLGDNPMALPRQLVAGDDDMDTFIAKLGTPTRANLECRLRYRFLRLTRKNVM